MVAALREFLKSSGGKAVAIGVTAAAVVLAVWSIKSNMGASSAQALSTDRMFICSETGKSFAYTIKAGDQIPVKSPHSGKQTGYEAEFCYWTKDGKIKPEPTLVLLNQHAGKKPPTFCPDCGRLVTPLNPVPSADMRPPPTEAEFAKRPRREP